MDIYYQAPLPPYDLYLNMLRAGVSRQTGVQTNDDAQSIECQTEGTSTSTATMQFPDDIGVGTSSTLGSGGGSKASSSAAGGDGSDGSQAPAAASKPREAMRLLDFLRRTAQAVETLLDENIESAELAALESVSKRAASSAGRGSRAVFGGDHIISLPSNLPYLAGRSIVDVAFSNGRPNDVLVAYTPVSGVVQYGEIAANPETAEVVQSGVKHLSAGGLLCLWDINDASAPRM